MVNFQLFANQDIDQGGGIFETGDYSLTSTHLFPFASQHQSRWICETHKDDSECASAGVGPNNDPAQSITGL